MKWDGKHISIGLIGFIATLCLFIMVVLFVGFMEISNTGYPEFEREVPEKPKRKRR